MHTLHYSRSSRDQLAGALSKASPPMREEIAKVARQIEDAVMRDPKSFPIFDAAATKPIRVACRLPLALYFSVDDQQSRVLICRIDGVFSET